MKPGEFLFVEWRDTALKAAAFRFESGRPQALGFACTVLGERTAEAASVELKTLVKKLRTASRRAYVILPRSQAIVRFLTLPSQDPVQIRAMLGAQIAQVLPYDLADLVYDFSVAHVEANGFSRVILVSFTKTVLARFTQMVTAAGLEIEDFLFSSQAQHFGALMASGRSEDDLHKAFVDIDADASDLVLFRGERLIYSRPMGLGSRMAMGGVPFEARLAAELKLSVDALRKECDFAKIDKILLTDEAELAPDVFAAIEGKLAVKPERLSLARLPMLVSKEAVKALRECLAKGFSLTALLGAPFIPDARRFVILSSEVRVRRHAEGRRREGVLVLAGLVAFIVVTLAAGGSLYGMQAARLKTLTGRLEELSQEAGPIAKMATRLDLLALARRRRLAFLEMLAELHRVAPSGVTLTELGYEEGQPLRIRGLALRGGEVSDFVSALEDSPLFRDAKFDFQQRRQVEGRSYYDFQISTGIDWDAPPGPEGEGP